MMKYPMMESLFYMYEERLAMDSEEISKLFEALDDELSVLSAGVNNEITSIVCRLCTEHERRAYISGFADAVQIFHELKRFENEIATSLHSLQ